MCLITNRKLSKANSLKCFGKSPNVKGPNELRLVRVDKLDNGWKVEPLDDQLTASKVKQLKSKYHLDIDTDKDWYASLEVACELFERAST